MRSNRNETTATTIVSFFDLGMKFPSSTQRSKLTMTDWRPAALYRARMTLASVTIDVQAFKVAN
jgi:hypothetical protein